MIILVSMSWLHMLRKLTSYDPNLLYIFFTTMILNASFPLVKTVLSVASPKGVCLLLCKVIEMFKSLWRHGRQIKK